MSLGDWTAWNSRMSRPRETVREDVAPEARPEDEPIEVREESLTDTAVMRIRRWIVGRER